MLNSDERKQRCACTWQGGDNTEEYKQLQVQLLQHCKEIDVDYIWVCG